MKKISLALLVGFGTLFTSIAGTNTSEEVVSHDTPLENGFGLKFHFGFTNENYGFPSDAEAKDVRPGVTYGLELGNQWYLWDDGQFGVGILATWIDMDFGYNKSDNDGFETEVANINLKVLEVGPIGTYSINDDMGIDGYYQLSPTIFSTGYAAGGGEAKASAGFGFTHALGVGFRYQLFYVGLEQNFGEVEVDEAGSDSDDGISLGKFDAVTSNTRLILGFKF